MEYPNWNGAVGSYFVHKRGENYWCGYHKVCIEPVTVLDDTDKVELACLTCIEEEEGGDVAEATIGEDEPALKADGFCSEAECFKPAPGKCQKCGGEFCGNHLYLPRVWCAECHNATEIDLDADETPVPDELDEETTREFLSKHGLVNTMEWIQILGQQKKLPEEGKGNAKKFMQNIRRRLILALGGHDPSAVSQLVYAARRASQELEGGSQLAGRIAQRLQQSIARVDPERGRIYGYKSS